jgi:hypothetical protein
VRDTEDFRPKWEDDDNMVSQEFAAKFLVEFVRIFDG